MIFAQKKEEITKCFFVVKKDTTFCTDLKVKSGMFGKIKSVKYTNSSNVKVKLNDAPNIIAYNIKGQDFEFLEYGAGKTFVERHVNGPFKTYFKKGGKTSWFFIRTPNGDLYDIHELGYLKKYKQHIRPIFMTCNALNQNEGEDLRFIESSFIKIKNKKDFKDYRAAIKAVNFTKYEKKYFDDYEKLYTSVIVRYNADCK